MRIRLQPSSTVREPHVRLNWVQSSLSLSPVHAQRLACSAPPQISGAVHEPQLTVRRVPHASIAVSSPHSADPSEHICSSLGGVHMHCVPPSSDAQVSKVSHVPHATTRSFPHRSVVVSLPHSCRFAEQSSSSVSALQIQTPSEQISPVRHLSPSTQSSPSCPDELLSQLRSASAAKIVNKKCWNRKRPIIMFKLKAGGTRQRNCNKSEGTFYEIG